MILTGFKYRLVYSLDVANVLSSSIKLLFETDFDNISHVVLVV